MADLTMDGVLPASLPSISSGQGQFYFDTTSSSTKPLPVVRWFDGTTFAFSQDALVVHLAGTETITGQKTFSLTPIFSAFSTTGLVHSSNTGVLTSSLLVAADVTANTLTNATLAQAPTLTLKGNNTGGTASVVDLTVAQVTAMLADGTTLDGGGSGNTLEVKAGGVGTSQLAANAVTNAKLAQAPANTIKGNNTGVTASELDLTVAQVTALLADGVTLDGAGTGSTLEVKAGGVGTTQLANGAVTLAKQANLTGPAWIGQQAGTAAPVALTPTQTTAMLNAATTALQGAMSATDKQKERLVLDLMADYGCKFDHRVVFDGACNTSSPGIITSATAAFVAGDVGKRIVLTGAGASGAMYAGTISSLNSGTSVNVTPSISTTVSAKGLQIHTDDLPGWTSAINDINNAVYPGAILSVETPNGATPFGASTFTGRSGVSSFLPTITKQFSLRGFGATANSDAGDYTKAGGSCLVYAGTSSAPTAFGALFTAAPPVSSTGQSLKMCSITDFWFDCRNGDGNEALKCLSLQSLHGFELRNVFIMDPAAVAIETLVVGPGNASALGEAKDFTRGTFANVHVRMLDTTPGGVTTAITTSSAITLSTTGQSMTVTANSLPASGYAWVMSSQGTYVLFNYTGGGGTTTLTGCTVSATDAQYSYATVSGSNIVQAAVSNGCALHMDGDATANTNLSFVDTLIISHGTTSGPAAVEFCNSDSMEMPNVVINGGNATNDGAINRIRKPGVRFNGHPTAAFHARNNCMKSGSPGAGGCSSMGVTNAAAKLAFPAGPNFWDLQQLGNAEPVPTKEQFSVLDWTPNGAPRAGYGGTVSVAAQSVAAATTALITGSVFDLGPQGFQPGLHLRWIVAAHPTTGAAVASSWLIKVGSAQVPGTDATIATGSLTGTAATTGGKITIDWKIRTIGAAATSFADYETNCGPATGLANALVVSQQPACATFNTVTSAPLYAYLVLTTGTGQVISVDDVTTMVLKGANP